MLDAFLSVGLIAFIIGFILRHCPLKTERVYVVQERGSDELLRILPKGEHYVNMFSEYVTEVDWVHPNVTVSPKTNQHQLEITIDLPNGVTMGVVTVIEIENVGLAVSAKINLFGVINNQLRHAIIIKMGVLDTKEFRDYLCKNMERVRNDVNASLQEYGAAIGEIQFINLKINPVTP